MEAIADDEMHASHRLNSLEEINALWHLCSRVLRVYISNEGCQEIVYIDRKVVAIKALVMVATLSVAGCTSSTSSNQAASSASSAATDKKLVQRDILKCP
ncbi:MAG: hypothetical protein WCB79_02670 [Halobacteriota archaeon]